MTRRDALGGGPRAGGPQLAPGAELAGYRIDTLLGRGGMGVVYRAHDLALDRNVALKLLAPELAMDVRFRERFLRESRLAASLDHPAIVPIYDAGEVAGQLYIAMRLVEGTDLKRLLAQEDVLEPQRVLTLLQQVADALDAAHEHGLVHRDVKPSNVLVDRRGHCYLADFGLSRRLDEHAAAQGGVRSLGTVDYVAPEQIRGEEIDGRADLYSLGCMLYECLAGRPPFAGCSDTAIVFAHLEDEPRRLPGLEQVIAKALAKDPAGRYESGRDLVEAARDALKPARSRRRWAFAALGVLVAVGGTTGGVLAIRDAHAPAHPVREALPLKANALSLIDARTHRVVADIDVAPAPVADAGTDLAFEAGSAWLLLAQEKLVLRVDLATHKLLKPIRLPWTPGERIASGGGLVWVTEDRNLGPTVLGIDARSGLIARRFRPFDLGQPGGRREMNFAFAVGPGVAYGDRSLWTTNGAEVLRIDPQSGRIEHHFATGATWVVFADGAVWTANGGDGSITKIDPLANAVTARVTLHGWLSDLTVGAGAVWASIVDDSRIFRLSEDDLSVQRAFESGPDPERLVVAAGQVWVANTGANALLQVTQGAGQLRQFGTGAGPAALTTHGRLIWAAGAPPSPPLAPGGAELRVGVSSPVHTDPVQRGAPIDEQVSYATCANLLTYPDSARPDGRRLVPEIAAAMPMLSHGGRTYTFQIRRGFRFSPPSNEPVTAETFRHTIERTLSPEKVQVWPYASDIVGAAAYTAGKARHISGISVRGDLLHITLARPSGDFLTRLSMPVFCPVPRAVPADPTKAPLLIASAGPYYIASVDTHRVVLERNPNYEGKRPRRADRIVFVTGAPTPRAVAMTDRGQLDYLPPDFANNSLLSPGGPLERKWGPGSAAASAGRQRYFLHDRPLVDTIALNTRRPLFRDIRLRQAVAYALDRPALARSYFDAPAASTIPSAVPGYAARHLYPLDGPDLGRARRLAGQRRRKAVLLAPCDPALARPAAIVRSNLARIGIALSIVRKPGVCDPSDVAADFTQADLMIGTNLGFGPTDRDPAPFLEGVLEYGDWGSPPGSGPWSSAAFRARLAKARSLSGHARIREYSSLADALDRAAPVLVYGAFQYNEYFASRVGCRLFQAFYLEVDLGALCVRKT
jgi:ABC-type transport system substrate-binding protein